MKSKLPDIVPVVEALDRYIIDTLDDGYPEEIQCVADLVNARIALVTTHLALTTKEKALPVRQNGLPLFGRRSINK